MEFLSQLRLSGVSVHQGRTEAAWRKTWGASRLTPDAESICVENKKKDMVICSEY